MHSVELVCFYKQYSLYKNLACLTPIGLVLLKQQIIRIEYVCVARTRISQDPKTTKGLYLGNFYEATQWVLRSQDNLNLKFYSQISILFCGSIRGGLTKEMTPTQNLQFYQQALRAGAQWVTPTTTSHKSYKVQINIHTQNYVGIKMEIKNVYIDQIQALCL